MKTAAKRDPREARKSASGGHTGLSSAHPTDECPCSQGLIEKEHCYCSGPLTSAQVGEVGLTLHVNVQTGLIVGGVDTLGRVWTAQRTAGYLRLVPAVVHGLETVRATQEVSLPAGGKPVSAWLAARQRRSK